MSSAANHIGRLPYIMISSAAFTTKDSIDAYIMYTCGIPTSTTRSTSGTGETVASITFPRSEKIFLGETGFQKTVVIWKICKLSQVLIVPVLTPTREERCKTLLQVQFIDTILGLQLHSRPRPVINSLLETICIAKVVPTLFIAIQTRGML